MHGLLIILIIIALGACTTPFESFHSHLREAVGDVTEDCGLVPLSEPHGPSVSCASAALASGKPFIVGFQLQGIDSEVWEGLVFGRDGAARRIRFDSDVGGGGHFFKEPRVHIEDCVAPSLSVSKSVRIVCGIK